MMSAEEAIVRLQMMKRRAERLGKHIDVEALRMAIEHIESRALDGGVQDNGFEQ